MKRIPLILVLLLAASLVLSACGEAQASGNRTALDRLFDLNSGADRDEREDPDVPPGQAYPPPEGELGSAPTAQAGDRDDDDDDDDRSGPPFGRGPNRNDNDQGPPFGRGPDDDRSDGPPFGRGPDDNDRDGPPFGRGPGDDRDDDRADLDRVELADQRLFLVSQVTGLDMVTRDGDRLGAVNSLLVSPHSGAVVYALVRADADLELENDLLALPLNAVELAREGEFSGDDADLDDDDRLLLVYRSDPAALANAPTFRDADLDRVLDRDAEQELAGFWAGEVGLVPVTGDEDASRLIRVHAGEAYSVVDRDGDVLGQIREMVVDPATARVSYAILSRGGLLGIGERRYLLPFEALRWERLDDGEDLSQGAFMLAVEPEVFEDAPRIADQDDLYDLLATGEARDSRRYWLGPE